MKIAILGSRGIPNIYGGFEQYADYLSVGLAAAGFDVSVYCSSTHPDKSENYHGVKRILCSDPEERFGTAGQFIYDLNCILDARKQGFDVIYQLGYTSNAIWWWLLPKKPVIVTNMDGLEWKRSKYSKPVRRFLKFAEGLAVRHSDHLIADSIGIQAYLQQTYQVSSQYFPYGADVFESPDPSALEAYGVAPYQYSMLIARMEPENNIEMIIEGHLLSEVAYPLLVVGNTNNGYGQYLETKYTSDRVRFLQGIYDQELLNNLRYHCALYFHGHSVGGTNPSLLEALGSAPVIAAHDNPFNKAIVEKDGFYFSESKDVPLVYKQIINLSKEAFRNTNYNKVQDKYTWEKIIKEHIVYMKNLTLN